MKKIISWLVRYVPRRYLQLFTGVGLKFIGFFYWGNQVLCPICDHHYKKFLPYGRLRARENALCPHCLSLERHRLMWLYLKSQTNFFSASLKILHIAPEPCFISSFEKQHQEGYITADIESPLAKVKMDIHHIPYADNYFDVVLCNHVLEHVRDDIQVMKEFNRVLRPGGWAILQVPFFAPIPETTFEDNSIADPREREKLFGQDDHVRKYGHDYTQRIAASGLIPSKENFSESFSGSEAFHFGISRGEIIYKAAKG
ncbi:MAG: class I SAM-dependent methyltransferase [Bacteroidetes bacterium]|nr:class I SAM-dependent methyltransferase [Bacteroidota bacterium]MBS1541075.1 class I SAM-dependent methyltransferase [Bacteroidota bacterium]